MVVQLAADVLSVLANIVSAGFEYYCSFVLLSVSAGLCVG